MGVHQQEQGKIVFTSNSLELHQQHEKQDNPIKQVKLYMNWNLQKHNCKEKGLQNQGLEKQG